MIWWSERCPARRGAASGNPGRAAIALPAPELPDGQAGWAQESGRTPSLSTRLRVLAERCEEEPLTLGALIAASAGRAYDVLVLLLVLPFMSPVPIPGLSSVFGAVILLIGLQRAVGREPVLPERLLRVRLPARFLKLTLSGAGSLLGWLERGLRPRLPALAQPGWQVVNGWMVAASGALLLLPLPVPLSNFFPAATILLLTVGHLQRDGRAVLAGFGLFAATLAFFAGIGLCGTALTEQIQRRWFVAE